MMGLVRNDVKDRLSTTPMSLLCLFYLDGPAMLTYRFSKNPHELWELMCEERQHRCEGAETGRKQNEERQLFLGIH